MPVGRIKILNRLQFQAGGVDFLLDGGQFFVRPKPVRVPGQSPAGVVADRLIAGLVAARGAEIIHEVDDEMRAAALSGETVMLRIELMAIKSQAEFHSAHDWENIGAAQS